MKSNRKKPVICIIIFTFAALLSILNAFVLFTLHEAAGKDAHTVFLLQLAIVFAVIGLGIVGYTITQMGNNA